MEGAQDNSLLLKAIAYSALPLHVGFERFFWMSPLPPRDHLINRSKKGWLFRIKKGWLAAINWVEDKTISKLGGALLIVDCWLCRWRRFLPLAALWWESVEGGREATREWRDSTQVLGDIHHKKQALDCTTSLHKNPFLFQQQSVAKLWFHVVGVKFSDQNKWMYI